ncbi:hypothetical protein BJ138DRAFT_1110073 [Hygrophoropsis aurantiaca]|uniref:Uncharacterized protein n=1 Tax=Hygrophoropsis aurantiaca TaxID=72124 RepID=A0ACB8ARI8_9AGAM|nr:hypothetical protein BJ138DRAFT_1110073 [Hygrophoropsis aurantiaca]
MASMDLWLWFRKVRVIFLASAVILCFIWTILIALYMGRNWTAYNSVQRGFLCGFVALDFISSILLYLMIVVKYRFWPDTARTAVLVGLHVVVSYATLLPFVAFLATPPPPPETPDELENPAINNITEPDTRRTHVSSGSHTWLLRNSAGAAPELIASDLPVHRGHSDVNRPHSYGSSYSSLDMKLVSHVNPNVSIVVGQPSAYTVSSPGSEAGSIVRTSTLSTADRDFNASSLSSQPYGEYFAHRAGSVASHTLPNRFQGDLMGDRRTSVMSAYSVASPASQYDFPASSSLERPTSRSIIIPPYPTASPESSEAPRLYRSRAASARQYTQSPGLGSRVASTSPLAANIVLPGTPGAQSVHSMMASVHDHPENNRMSHHSGSGFLSPPLTALPTPRYASGSSPATFELHLSDVSRSSSVDVGDLMDIASGTSTRLDSINTTLEVDFRGRPHVRNDSLGSNVDLDEWKRHVLLAAGRAV